MCKIKVYFIKVWFITLSSLVCVLCFSAYKICDFHFKISIQVERLEQYFLRYTYIHTCIRVYHIYYVCLVNMLNNVKEKEAMHKIIVLIQFQNSFIQTRPKAKNIQTSIITLKDIGNDGVLKEQAIYHQESTGHKHNICKCQKIHSQWKKPGRKSTHNRIQPTWSPINCKLIFTDWNKSFASLSF